ncbi:glycoside hydrolase family 19 protein [Maritalea sp.]|jgi:putative chitinase|uniref:glycoside hydrolase family 19 protein n=1 Tax=Maritalea sp. TaxID=2003361 RepID=UPI0039E382C0
MQLTAAHLKAIALGPTDMSNIHSIVDATNKYGSEFGMLVPHRLAHFIAQLGGESAGFRYDREIWGPTAAQRRYDVRTDLGNTPERDGDGKKNAGRGPIQVTGGYNIGEFFKWCNAKGFNPPNFVDNPDLINTDPWEGLSAIWYWETRNLNKWADQNDIETIRKRVNGGLNGYDLVLTYYTRAGLVLLGRNIGKTSKTFENAVRKFQEQAKADGTYKGEVDGDDGPKTRAALHTALVAIGKAKGTQAAPVVVDKPVNVPVEPKGVTKPGKDIWTLVVTFVAGTFATFANLALPMQIAIFAFFVVGLILIATGRWNLAKSAKEIKAAIEAAT